MATSRTAALETVVWVLIYGGLLVIGLGYALWHQDVDWGLWVMVFGAVDAATGVVLIWVRSKVKDVP